jgi:hypothetical protein
MMHDSFEARRRTEVRVPSRILRWLRVRISGSGAQRRPTHQSLFSEFFSAFFSVSSRRSLPVAGVERRLPV